ncbi:MAG: (Fe-S)-binding protein [Chloroflexi bacterium]|nr:(Fe-S)-binding protein [Chloroflexota bacterium]
MADKTAKELVPPGLTYIADNIISRHNILGAPKGQGAKWAKDLNLPGRGETIFFAGCGYQYTGELKTLLSLIRKMDKSAIGSELPMRLAGFQKKLGADITGIFARVAGGSDTGAQPLKDAVKVLDRLGISFGYLGEDEPCCGAPLHFSGLRKEFAENARQTYKTFKSLGVKRIIGIVPSCTYALRNLLSAHIDGFDLEVKHFTEAVLENLPGKKLRFPREVRVTYHDPCQLTRYLKLVDEPRRILGSIQGIELVETDWTRGRFATCCGGGGGFEAVFPELSEILAVNRARELVETGAQLIVTNCPGCVMQLEEGLKGLKADKVEVLDLAQVVAMAMEG